MGNYIEKIFINGCSHTEKILSINQIDVGRYSNVNDRGFTSSNDWLTYSKTIGRKYNLDDNCFDSNGAVLDKYSNTFKLIQALLIDWAQHFYFYNKLVLHQNISSYSIHEFEKIETPSIYLKNYEVLTKIKDNPYILNFAKSGKGNDYMFMETISVIEQLKDKNKKPELAIIQLSGLNRRITTRSSDVSNSHSIDGSHIYFATPWDTNDYRELAPTPIGEMTTLFNLYSLQEYFKSNNIKYLFLNYFPFTDFMKNQFIFDKINKQHFVMYDDESDLFVGWIDKMKKDDDVKLYRDSQGHPNTTGYLYMFHRIILKLNELYNMNYDIIPSYNEIFSKSNNNLL